MRAYMPVLIAAGGVILVAACSAYPPASGPARTAAADPRQCFYVPNVRGFREGAGDTVIVNTSSRDYYLLQTFGHCDIDYELQIGFDASGGNFVCSNGGSCAAGQPGPTDNAMVPRLILADAETGIGVGHTMFMGNTDMHMFKLSGGMVHAVHAILGMASSSGW